MFGFYLEGVLLVLPYDICNHGLFGSGTTSWLTFSTRLQVSRPSKYRTTISAHPTPSTLNPSTLGTSIWPYLLDLKARTSRSLTESHRTLLTLPWYYTKVSRNPMSSSRPELRCVKKTPKQAACWTGIKHVNPMRHGDSSS